jgi:hypothetical protein
VLNDSNAQKVIHTLHSPANLTHLDSILTRKKQKGHPGKKEEKSKREKRKEKNQTNNGPSELPNCRSAPNAKSSIAPKHHNNNTKEKS